MACKDKKDSRRWRGVGGKALTAKPVYAQASSWKELGRCPPEWPLETGSRGNGEAGRGERLRERSQRGRELRQPKLP